MADKDLDGTDELYSTWITGGTPVKLHPALVSFADIGSYRISPNSQVVVFSVDHFIDDKFELYGFRSPAAARSG